MIRHLVPYQSIILMLLLPGVLVAAPKPDRGQLLYDNHCLECHVTEVHFREKRQVQSLADLRAETIRWMDELKLEWTAEEVSDVVEYLNLKYYQFPPAGPL